MKKAARPEPPRRRRHGLDVRLGDDAVRRRGRSRRFGVPPRSASFRPTGRRSSSRRTLPRPRRAGSKSSSRAPAGAAHLPGMLAAQTAVPVLGVPVESRALEGLDSLLSIAQMPAGIPVGTSRSAGRRHQRGAPRRRDSFPSRPPDLRRRLQGVPRRRRRGRSCAADPAVIVPPGSVGRRPRERASSAACSPSPRARMGYRVHTYSPEEDSPTGHVADVEVSAPYDDLDRLRAFAKELDVLTFEFENVPRAALDAVDGARPGPPVSRGAVGEQNREREKEFLRRVKAPVAIGRQCAHPRTSRPPLLRRRPRRPQDGRIRVRREGPGEDSSKDAVGGAGAWASPRHRCPCVLEAFIDFEREVSVIAARGTDGRSRSFSVSRTSTPAHPRRDPLPRPSFTIRRDRLTRSRGRFSKRSITSASSASSSSTPRTASCS